MKLKKINWNTTVQTRWAYKCKLIIKKVFPDVFKCFLFRILSLNLFFRFEKYNFTPPRFNYFLENIFLFHNICIFFLFVSFTPQNSIHYNLKTPLSGLRGDFSHYWSCFMGVSLTKYHYLTWVGDFLCLCGKFR